MPRPNKKGTALINQYTIGMVIALMGFFLLAGTIGRWYVNAKDDQAETICRDTVLARVRSTFEAKINNVALTQFNVAPLLCKTVDVEIKETEPEKVKEELASLMSRCKHMFADGLYSNVFDEFLGGRENCFPCFTVVTNQIQPIQKRQFEEYLLGTRAAQKFNKGLAYYDYLTNFKGVRGRIEIDSEGIKPYSTYLIFYADPNQAILPWQDAAEGYNGVYLLDPNKPLPTTSITVENPLGDDIDVAEVTCQIVAGAEQQ